jgi:hypothetical protein
MIPAPRGYHGCATCRHRRPATPYMTGLTGYLHPAGGGSRRHGDTWCPWSCPELGAGAAGTRGTPGVALRREVGAGVVGTRGVPGAALR